MLPRSLRCEPQTARLSGRDDRLSVLEMDGLVVVEADSKPAPLKAKGAAPTRRREDPRFAKDAKGRAPSRAAGG